MKQIVNISCIYYIRAGLWGYRAARMQGCRDAGSPSHRHRAMATRRRHQIVENRWKNRCKMEPKVGRRASQGAKEFQKGTQREPKGTQRKPKAANEREPKGTRRAAEGRGAAMGGKMEAPRAENGSQNDIPNGAFVAPVAAGAWFRGPSSGRSRGKGGRGAQR